MKETTTAYYCDATGGKIDDLFEMIVLEVHRPFSRAQPAGMDDEEMHLSKDAHELEYNRVEDNHHELYISEVDTVAMIKESRSTRTVYYGRDTQDEAIQDLIETLDSVLSEPASTDDNFTGGSSE